MLTYQTVSAAMEKIRNESGYPGYGFVYAKFFFVEIYHGEVRSYGKRISSQSELDEMDREPELALVFAGQYGTQTRAIGFTSGGQKDFDYENRSRKCNFEIDGTRKIRGDVRNIVVRPEENAENLPDGSKLMFRMSDGSHLSNVV